MDTEPNPPVSTAKRVFFCVLVLLIVGVVAGFAALAATARKEIPHPWGEVRLMGYSTNASGTMTANFRFRNLFEWAVFMDVALEVNDGRKWELARGYTMFVPIEDPVASKRGQNFAVPVPFDCKEWRVLVRAARGEFGKTDLQREKVKEWLDSHGAAFLGKKLQADDPNGYILSGPLMKWDKPGQLPTAYSGTPVRWPAWEPFPQRGRRICR